MDNKPIQFGAIENTPPYVFEKDGKLTGFVIELFEEIQKRAGFHAEVQVLPARRMVHWGEKGILDGVLQIYHDTTRTSFIYSSIPSHVTPYSIFIKKGDEGLWKGSTIDDLKSRRIGWNSGYRLTAEMQHAVDSGWFILDEAKDTDQNLLRLLSGRIECFINNQYLTLFEINRLKIADQITYLDAPFFPKKATYMAISRASKRINDKQVFMAKFNDALESLYSDGTATRILDHYLN